MSRTLERRLERVEASLKPAQSWRCHTLMGDTHEELATKEAELRASPEWQEGDNLILIRFVDPAETRGAARQQVLQ